MSNENAALPSAVSPDWQAGFNAGTAASKNYVGNDPDFPTEATFANGMNIHAFKDENTGKVYLLVSDLTP